MTDCPKCGAQINGNAAFCGKCGFKLASAADNGSSFAPATGKLIKQTGIINYSTFMNTQSVGGRLEIYDDHLSFKKLLPFAVGGHKDIPASDIASVETYKPMGFSHGIIITNKSGKKFHYVYGIGMEAAVQGDVAIIKSIANLI